MSQMDSIDISNTPAHPSLAERPGEIVIRRDRALNGLWVGLIGGVLVILLAPLYLAVVLSPTIVTIVAFVVAVVLGVNSVFGALFVASLPSVKAEFKPTGLFIVDRAGKCRIDWTNIQEVQLQNSKWVKRVEVTLDDVQKIELLSTGRRGARAIASEILMRCCLLTNPLAYLRPTNLLHIKLMNPIEQFSLNQKVKGFHYAFDWPLDRPVESVFKLLKVYCDHYGDRDEIPEDKAPCTQT